MHERVAREIAMVRERHPGLQYGEQLNWVFIPDYPLPPGRYNKNRTRLLFVIPPGYPNTGPDNFFVDADLRLTGGSNPPGFNPGRIPAAIWRRFQAIGHGSPGTPSPGAQGLPSRVEIIS